MRISVNQMAEMYGVQPGTQWIWRRDSRLPFLKGSKEISYDQEDIQKLALDNKLNTKAYNLALKMEEAS